MVTVNGIRLKRRRMASSTERRPGLWLPADHQLELRQVIEEVLAHEARRDLVAAGQRLDLGFGPAPTFLGLGGGDEPRAAQAR